MLAGAALCLAAAPAVPERPPAVRAEGGFSAPFFDEDARVRYLIRGETAKALVSEGQFQLQITQFRLESYDTNKTLELTIAAPECLFDNQSAWSSGAIQLQSADGRLVIRGEGFRWQQTNATLSISNRVETIIRRSVPRLPGGPAATADVGTGLDAPTRIMSDRFQFDLGAKVVNYEDEVRVYDPEMELTCGLLTARLRSAGSEVETIQARGSVRLVDKAGASEATADEAFYTESNHQVELSGHAAWRQGMRSVEADRLVLDRREKEFSALGHAIVHVPRGTFSPVTLLVNPLGPPLPSVDPSDMITAFADGFTSRSNLVRLQGNVRLLDVTNRLTCGLLTLQAAATEAEEEVVTAEQDVMVERGSRRVWSDRAVYTRSAQAVVFSGNPRWSVDEGEGGAGRLLFDLKENAVRAAGNVSALMPLAGSGLRLDFLTGLDSGGGESGQDKRTVRITADDLEVRGGVATFSGQVRAKELPGNEGQPCMTCGVLKIRLAAAGNQIECIEAARVVTIERGKRGVTNGAAVWQRFCCDALTARVHPTTGLLDTAVARGDVLLERDRLRATGTEALYAAEKRTIEFTGAPVIETPQFIMTQAEALVWDVASNRCYARGRFKVELPERVGGQPGQLWLKKDQRVQRP
jgi:lipopolysaccharide transport protein LptA